MMDLALPASATFVGGLVLGALGSVHCLGMCGGIAAALSVRENTTTAVTARRSLLSSAGRVSSYVTAGAIAGGAGLLLSSAIGPRGALVLRALAGLLLVSVGLYLLGWNAGVAHLERAGAGVWRRISKRFAAQRLRTTWSAVFLTGVLWGWLPCGLVYSALSLATTTGHPLQGALVMLGFGLGTAPAVVGAGLAGGRLPTLLARTQSRRWAGAFVVVFGLWTIAINGMGAMHATDAGADCPLHHESSSTVLEH